MSDDDVYKKLRAEMISLLGFVEPLNTAQQIKVDMATSLRLALDNFTAQQLAGEKVDTAKLLSAAEALERLLPRTAAFDAQVKTPADINIRARVERAFAEIVAAREAVGGMSDEDQALRFDRQPTERDQIIALQAALAEADRIIAEKNQQIAALGGDPLESSPQAAAPAATPEPEQPKEPQRPPPSLRVEPPPHFLSGYKPEPWADYVGNGSHRRRGDRWGPI